MEDWQKLVIEKNLPELIESTTCTKTLIAKLISNNVISKEEKQKIDAIHGSIDQADKLYELLVTRNNAYQVLLSACTEGNQSGVVRILEEGEYEHKLSQALHDCNVSEFICRCFISTSDFESIQQAISRYSEITQFKTVFDENDPSKPWLLRGPKNETLLHIATAYGYIKLMKYLIKLGIDVNELDNDGRTAGHYLGKFSTNIIEVTSVLLSNGLNFRHVDNEGLTAAHTLAIYGNVNQFHYRYWAKHIIGNGYGDVFGQKSNKDETPLQHLMESIEVDKNTFELLRNSGNNNQGKVEDNLDGLLRQALLSGKNVRTIKNFVQLGASIHARFHDGNRPLHHAVMGGNTDAMQYLISQGADLNAVNRNGLQPLHAVPYGRAKNYFDIIKLLLDSGADLNSRIKNGQILTHIFGYVSNVNFDDFKIWVAAMIKNGHANSFAMPDCSGRTPLHIAINNRDLDLETMKLIIESANLDINQPDDDGYTMLHLALGRGNLNITKNLVELGADWKKRGLRNCTVMHLAVRSGFLKAFMYFKSLGADVNARDEDGETPLHYVRFAHISSVLWITTHLLNTGAELNAKNKDGKTLDHLMSSCDGISSEEYCAWKHRMIHFGYTSLFQEQSI